MNIRSHIKKYIDRIRSSGFLKSVLTLSSGVVVAQAINFFGMPLIGRIYTPGAMGDYTQITANANVILSVACLGMMTVFMLPEKDEEARGLSRLVTASTALISAAANLLLWAVSGSYQLFQTEETPYGLSLVVLWLYILFYTVNNICYAYVNRRGLYKVMFWNPVLGAAVNIVAGVVFGLMGWGFLGYTGAHILSFIVNIVHLAIHANPFEKVKNPDYHCFPLLKSYRRFPIYQMPANLLASLSAQIPVHMLGTLFSSSVLGMYSMAIKILALPSAFLATPVNRVYFREASMRFVKGEDIGEFSFKILKTNIKLAIIPIMILTVFGEWIFSVFLGEQWRTAGTYAAILGIYYLMLFCSDCLSGRYVIIHKNKLNLYLAIYKLLSNIGVYIVSYFWIKNVYYCLLLMTCMELFYCILDQGIFLKQTGVSLPQYGKFICFSIILPVLLAWGVRWLIWR